MPPLPFHLSFLWLGTFSLFPLAAAVSSPDHIMCNQMMAMIDQVAQKDGRDFCEVDQPCRDGMGMALAQIKQHLIGQKPGQSIPTMSIIRILKTETHFVKKNCLNCYIGKGRRQQCYNGALAAASFIATTLGINSAAPSAPSTQGPPYAGYEQYNSCLRNCGTRTPPPLKGCPAYCQEQFDLKAFLNSLPQVK